MRQVTLSAIAMAIAVAIPGTASAHVGLEKSEASVGASYKAVFKVPHGCEGSPTTSVSITIPEGVVGVKPMPKAGWKITIERAPYEKEYAFYHGKKLTEGVRKVTWTGGPLLDEHYDEFVLNSFIAKELPADSVISFPVTQQCEKGELHWVEVPAPGQDAHSLKAPAPRLKLVAAAPSGHHHHGHGKAAAENKQSGLVIDAPWMRATPKGARVAAGYLKIRNTGGVDDILLGGSADFVERVEVHESSEKDGVASMQKLNDGLKIPAGGAVELKPAGLHLMLMGLKKPLAAGESAQMVLKFKNAGDVKVDLAVTPLGQAGPGDHHHHQH